MDAAGSKPKLKWWDAVLCLLAALILAGAWLSGLATNAVNIFLMATVPVGIISRGWWAYKNELATELIRRPSSRDCRWYWFQCLNRLTFLAVWFFVLKISIIPLQLGAEYERIWMLLVVVLVVCALLQLLPKKRILLAQNISTMVVTVFFAAQLFMAAGGGTAADAIVLDSPFRAEAYVFQGGPSPLLNHHFILRSQRNALDILVPKNQGFVDGNEQDLSSHGCFGQMIHAPASGQVVKILDDRPDMAVGKVDHEQILGNHVVVEIARDRYVLLAHLKQGSILVRAGDEVGCGQPLAQCGNSGNTSAPHLHLQVQNRADFNAADLRTFPILFRNATRVSGTSAQRGQPTSLRRNDRLLSTERVGCSITPEEGDP